MYNFLLRPFKLLRVHPEDKILYRQIKKKFGFRPINIGLYRIALTHKSATAAIANGKKINNERLEYLGDAVLDAIVAEYLFAKFPNQREGFLTKMRSRLVSRQHLNALAIGIGLHEMVVSQTLNAPAQKHIYGDALEAFIGALYLDRGFDATTRWIVKRLFSKHIDLGEMVATETDYKSRMIEWSQKNKVNIIFDSQELALQKGNVPYFEAKLFINGQLVGSGIGHTKKEAEQHASLVALERTEIALPPELPGSQLLN